MPQAMYSQKELVKALGDALILVQMEFPDYLQPVEKMRYKKVALRVISLTLDRLGIKEWNEER